MNTATISLLENEQTTISTGIIFSLVDDGNNRYGADCILKKKSGVEAFVKVFGEDPKSTKADIVIKVNGSYSFLPSCWKAKMEKKRLLKQKT
ncbi:hypothetical protein [Chryseobacterium sp. GP-SGM7]|uniref:hypothetical protein n=1 Tax=Chryseobacterium sp. GP-SGM7 TaxID=3411323 RepID=UPI003B93ED51